MLTRAAVLREVPGQYEVAELELDDPCPGELRVKMKAAGLCHSDDHFATGTQQPPILPIVGGHEGAGIVDAVGPGTTGFSEGDHVVFSFLPVCGRCWFCAKGMQNLCQLGASIGTGARFYDPASFRLSLDGQPVGQLASLGVFSEYVTVHVESAIKLDASIAFDVACLTGCGVGTGWGAAVNSAQVRPGQVVIVMGIGGIGINAVQGAAHAGADVVIAVDPVEFKRESALKLGATHAYSDIEEAADFARSITNGQGADATVVTVGVLKGKHVGQGLDSVRMEKSRPARKPREGSVEQLRPRFRILNIFCIVDLSTGREADRTFGAPSACEFRRDRVGGDRHDERKGLVMPSTIVEQLAEFAVGSDSSALPAVVVEESKRILLDSLGCAVASLGERGAEIAVKYGQVLGGTGGDASILGTGVRTSEIGAGFANAELINALDQDAVLPPGHVTPYVLPAALAAAEARSEPGSRVLTAIAVAHEMSYRIGKSTDYLRDMKDGVVTTPSVIGYSSTIFGATAAVGVAKRYSRDTVANALGLAGCTAPVNYQRAWFMHAPPSTIKYQLAGGMAQTAMTAAHLAEFGHRGDLQILDDREFGWPRFIGTSRWVPEPITDGLGTDWKFTAEQSFKPYPHCRILHALLDALTEIVEDNDIKPDEIESIRAWGESFVLKPIWLNDIIEDVRDAQFSMAHGLAVGAHRLPPGKQWQDPDVVFGPSVKDLMTKVTYEPHPDYADALTSNPAARQSRIEVSARGTTYSAERDYPNGSPSPDPSSYMTTDELSAKFRRNVQGVLSDADADSVIQAVLELESVDDIRAITSKVRPASGV